MKRDRLAAHLRRLGLPADSGAVYLALLDRSPGPLEALAADAGLDDVSLRAAYERLVEVGLATALGTDDAPVTPLPPAAGLEVLSRHRTAVLDDARIAVASAFESFRRSRLSQYTDNLVEVVTGETIGSRVRQAVDGARAEVRRFDSPPYFITTIRNNILVRVEQRATTFRRAGSSLEEHFTNNLELLDTSLNNRDSNFHDTRPPYPPANPNDFTSYRAYAQNRDIVDRGIAINYPDTDIDGNPRIAGAAIDLGPFEIR